MTHNSVEPEQGGQGASEKPQPQEEVGGKQVVVSGDTSDGYHTFNELYKFRLLYNAALFNEWYFYESQYGGTIKPTKSWKHSDGELCFGGGWFVVTAQLPTGQITNHYEANDWDLFKIPEVDQAPEWDGHTPQDVSDRLERYLRGNDMTTTDPDTNSELHRVAHYAPSNQELEQIKNILNELRSWVNNNPATSNYLGIEDEDYFETIADTLLSWHKAGVVDTALKLLFLVDDKASKQIINNFIKELQGDDK